MAQVEEKYDTTIAAHGYDITYSECNTTICRNIQPETKTQKKYQGISFLVIYTECRVVEINSES